MSDVVAGAALGTIVGRSVVRGDGGTAGEARERRWSLGLDDGPSGDGVGLALKFDFSRRH